MADSKLTALTEDTSPSSTDLAYSVKDPAGTPLSRKVTWLNAVKAGLSGVFSFASSSGPSSLAFFEDTDNGTNKITVTGVSSVASDKTLTLPDRTGTLVTRDQATFVTAARTTLTDKTSFSGTGAEQWGTEEATVDDATLPTPTGSVIVQAWCFGYIQNFTGDTSVLVQVEISLDGGSSWNSGVGLSVRAGEVQGTNTRKNAANGHLHSGSVTGDIQARVMVTSSLGAAAVQDCLSGHLMVQVIQQPT